MSEERAPSGERGRWSSRRKMEVVLRALRGEDLDVLSRELGVTAGTIAQWREQFLAHFGWCPADAQSGKYKNAHPRLSKAGNRYVWRMIWLLGVGAVSHHGPYRDCVDRRTVAGKNKMDTLVAIGRTLLTTIYAILKSGRRYDPAYRSAARALPATA